VRLLQTQSLTGERQIDISESSDGSVQGVSGGGDGGAIGKLWTKLKRFAGFLFSKFLNFISFSFTQLWDVLVDSYFSLKTFDWNSSDKEIEEQITRNNQSIIDASGSLVGAALGWGVAYSVSAIAVGVGAALGNAKARGSKAARQIFIPKLPMRIALAVAEEGGEEVRDRIQDTLLTAAYAMKSNFALCTLLNARKARLFGLSPINDDNLPPATLMNLQEDLIDKIAQGIQSSPIEDIVQKILPGTEVQPYDWRAAVEEAFDEFEDAIIDAGYVITQEMDDFYAEQKFERNNEGVERRIVAIKPDKRNNEIITLDLPNDAPNQAREEISQAITTARIMGNRDVGQIVGEPLKEYMRKGFQLRKLSIRFHEVPVPPWKIPDGNRLGQRAKFVDYSVPDVRRGLTWTELKKACGGANGFLWGRYRCCGKLSSKRCLIVWGATPEEAEFLMRNLYSLMDASVQLEDITITEHAKVHPRRKKEPTRMFPSWASILIRENSLDDLGRVDMSGKVYDERKTRVELWPDSEPEGSPPLG
jgi:hypothetical protein